MADEEQAGGGGAGNHLVTILLLLNAVLMGAVAFLQYSTHEAKTKEPAITDVIKAEMKAIALEKEKAESGVSGEAMAEDGILFPLQGFTANLAQGDGPRRFLRLSAVLKFSKESNEEEFKARKPQIRDSVIGILNSKRPEDLLKVEGKNYLKEEIKAAINSFLIDGQLVDVYYVGFQVN